MKLHLLRCGSMSVSPAVPYGNRISLRNTARQLLADASHRVELPVWTFLIEHPRGPVLVDTGWCRELSPNGVYDAGAAASVLPGYLAAFYRPVLPRGEAIHWLREMAEDPACAGVFCSHDPALKPGTLVF